jgi:hypothetical protein
LKNKEEDSNVGNEGKDNNVGNDEKIAMLEMKRKMITLETKEMTQVIVQFVFSKTTGAAPTTTSISTKGQKTWNQKHWQSKSWKRHGWPATLNTEWRASRLKQESWLKDSNRKTTG